MAATGGASVARGLALFVALLALVLAGQALVGARGADGPSLPACGEPVELVSRGASARPACVGDAVLAACGALAAGDRVVLGPGGCARDPGGMRATWRLAYGLKLDANRASAGELALLERIGPRLGAAIVADRVEHGPYATLDDLARVRGVGRALLAAVADHLEVVPARAPGR